MNEADPQVRLADVLARIAEHRLSGICVLSGVRVFGSYTPDSGIDGGAALHVVTKGGSGPVVLPKRLSQAVQSA